MIPNNNLSVLPWYTSIEQQNARKWWVYGRVYPLFTPAMFMLPFQIMRTPRRAYSPGGVISETGQLNGAIDYQGHIDFEKSDYIIYIYNFPEPKVRVYFENIPKPENNFIIASALDSRNQVIGVFNPSFDDRYTGYWDLPSGTKSIHVQVGNVHIPDTQYGFIRSAQETGVLPIQFFKVYTKNGVLVGDFTQPIKDAGLTVKALQNYDVIVFGGQTPVFTQFANGQYYASISDGVETWYSEIFTVVNDISPYLKIEWWDNEDFVMDAGTIVYKYAGNTQFKNALYLQADIAKPEYIFEEEGETRDGYFFPTKQISEKKYRFSFLASEYLLDVMRFIRMADYAYIEKNGQRYSLDTFLITPDWEDNGDVASVAAEFETATVAKKIGKGYIMGQQL